MSGSVRWRKVRGDLGQYRARTALVVASIAIGAFAVGTIAGTDALLRQNLNDGYAATRPAAASMYTATGFDRELVDVVRAMPGVDQAEGRRSVIVRLLGADGTAREMLLTALPDFADQRIDLVGPQAGRFPPRRSEVAFERSSLRLMDVAPGDTVRIRTPGGREYDLDVSGLAHEPGASPAFYFGRLNAYVTFETLRDLGWDDSFDELRIRVDDPEATRAEVRAIADDVRLRVERAGASVTFALVPEPGQHPANDLLQAVFVVLGGIGLLLELRPAQMLLVGAEAALRWFAQAAGALFGHELVVVEPAHEDEVGGLLDHCERVGDAIVPERGPRRSTRPLSSPAIIHAPGDV